IRRPILAWRQPFTRTRVIRVRLRRNVPLESGTSRDDLVWAALRLDDRQQRRHDRICERGAERKCTGGAEQRYAEYRSDKDQSTPPTRNWILVVVLSMIVRMVVRLALVIVIPGAGWLDVLICGIRLALIPCRARLGRDIRAGQCFVASFIGFAVWRIEIVAALFPR